MTLHGLAPTTQHVYVNTVKQLAAYYRRSPAEVSEQELRDYFTYLIKKKRLAIRAVAAASAARIRVIVARTHRSRRTIQFLVGRDYTSSHVLARRGDSPAHRQ